MNRWKKLLWGTLFALGTGHAKIDARLYNMFDASEFDLEASFQQTVKDAKRAQASFAKMWTELDRSPRTYRLVIVSRPMPSMKTGSSIYQALMIPPSLQSPYRERLKRTPLAEDFPALFPPGSESDVYVEINYLYAEGKGILVPERGLFMHELLHAYEYEQFAAAGTAAAKYAPASYATTLKAMETEAVLYALITGETDLGARERAAITGKVKNLADLLSAYRTRCALTDVDVKNATRALNEIWPILKKHGYAEPKGPPARSITLDDLVGLNALFGAPILED